MTVRLVAILTYIIREWALLLYRICLCIYIYGYKPKISPITSNFKVKTSMVRERNIGWNEGLVASTHTPVVIVVNADSPVYIKTNTTTAKVLMKYARGKSYLLDGRLSNLSKRHFAQVYTDTSIPLSSIHRLLSSSSTSLNCRTRSSVIRNALIYRRSCEQIQTGQNRPSILIYLARPIHKVSILIPVPSPKHPHI